MDTEEQLHSLRKPQDTKQTTEIQNNIQQQPALIKIKSKQQKGNEQPQFDHKHIRRQRSKAENNLKRKKYHRKDNINKGIIYYCVFTCLSCFVLETFWLYPLGVDLYHNMIRSIFSFIVVSMSLWSYYQTIRTKNTFKKLRGYPNISNEPHIQSNYLSNECQLCNYAKPARVSHCSTCGHCIMKLDHHCFWSQNCIGYRNQKSFYLFTLYMTLGVFQFWLATYDAFFYLYGSGKFLSSFEPGVYILWIITCFSALFVGIMIVALLISHTMMVLTNHTTLMSMKMHKMCPLPFIQFRKFVINEESYNPYDRGQIQNIRSLFGTNIFLAFLPLTRQIKHDFLFQSSNPIPTPGQLLALAGGGQAEYQRQQELRFVILKLKDLYKNQKFKYNDSIIEVK